jgi:hypothetical protein
VGDEGGGLAVLGRNIDLLVDHGRFFACYGSGFWLGSIRLQGKGSMTRRTAITLASTAPLNSVSGIAIVSRNENVQRAERS